MRDHQYSQHRKSWPATYWHDDMHDACGPQPVIRPHACLYVEAWIMPAGPTDHESCLSDTASALAGSRSMCSSSAPDFCDTSGAGHRPFDSGVCGLLFYQTVPAWIGLGQSLEAPDAEGDDPVPVVREHLNGSVRRGHWHAYGMHDATAGCLRVLEARMRGHPRHSSQGRPEWWPSSEGGIGGAGHAH